MQANKLLADQSRKSTSNMESLTHDMRKVAHKTKSETVSMKIITLVTLFFLPGTFISVGYLFVFSVSCCPGIRSHKHTHINVRKSSSLSTRTDSRQTLMSTDIVHWDHTNGVSSKVFQSGALKVYLAVSLPLMFVTFGVWYVFGWLEKRKQKHNMERLDASMA